MLDAAISWIIMLVCVGICVGLVELAGGLKAFRSFAWGGCMSFAGILVIIAYVMLPDSTMRDVTGKVFIGGSLVLLGSMLGGDEEEERSTDRTSATNVDRERTLANVHSHLVALGRRSASRRRPFSQGSSSSSSNGRSAAQSAISSAGSRMPRHNRPYVTSSSNLFRDQDQKQDNNTPARGNVLNTAGNADTADDRNAAKPAEVTQRQRSYQCEPEEAAAATAADLCAVCMVAPNTFAMVPCGHRCLCARCQLQWSAGGRPCPICRSEVKHTLKIHDAGVLTRSNNKQARPIANSQ